MRIGNSQGVRLPKAILEQADLVAGDEIEVRVEDGEIRIVPVEPEVTLLLASESALSDWNRPEEDAAWAHLQ